MKSNCPRFVEIQKLTDIAKVIIFKQTQNTILLSELRLVRDLKFYNSLCFL
jgi:hypothetical protein